MTIVLSTPAVDEVRGALAVLREWQDDGAPMQLHPGDIGWYYRFGAAETASAVRTWSRDGRILAVGLLDGPTLLRVTAAPGAFRDEELAERLAEDLSRAGRDVFPEGEVSVEAPPGLLLHDRLTDRGWGVDEPWTPLYRDLAAAVEDPGVRVGELGLERAEEFAAVLRSAFGTDRPSAAYRYGMASGPFAADARCLGIYDGGDAPVAVVTVWSAGPGRPGLVEPMGVHADHRGRGLGRAVTLAGAAALREMGASSVRVCTPTENAAAIATYEAAGFTPQPEITDRVRKG
ncbi:GNAT family N-acetyltransferase [Streptomyces termitum]|uniref:GNAT family N-acetyltransferase n=1 Tax=Streptomyces termitum TaxID=67368 RepID=UPI0033B5E459